MTTAAISVFVDGRLAGSVPLSEISAVLAVVGEGIGSKLRDELERVSASPETPLHLTEGQALVLVAIVARSSGGPRLRDATRQLAVVLRRALGIADSPHGKRC